MFLTFRLNRSSTVSPTCGFYSETGRLTTTNPSCSSSTSGQPQAGLHSFAHEGQSGVGVYPLRRWNVAAAVEDLFTGWEDPTCEVSHAAKPDGGCLCNPRPGCSARVRFASRTKRESNALRHVGGNVKALADPIHQWSLTSRTMDLSSRCKVDMGSCKGRVQCTNCNAGAEYARRHPLQRYPYHR
jgi:hypothetical protein